MNHLCNFWPLLHSVFRPPRYFVVLYFLPRVLRRDVAAGWSPSPWVTITSPLRRQGPHVAAVPSIWSERSTHCVRACTVQSAVLGETYSILPAEEKQKSTIFPNGVFPLETSISLERFPPERGVDPCRDIAPAAFLRHVGVKPCRNLAVTLA